MKKLKLTQLALFAALAFALNANAQSVTKFQPKKTILKETELKRWSHLDLAKDSVPGMSVDKAYSELLKDKQGVKVIVGVVDSGVDIDHEDLKAVIWTNSKEIASNGIDDDKNGYIDDIHGWNFLGDSDNENLEMTRIVKKGDDGSPEYKAAKAEYDKELNDAYEQKQQVDFIFEANKGIVYYLGKSDYTINDLNSISAPNENIFRYQQIMTRVLTNVGPDFNTELNEYHKHVYDQLDYQLNQNFNGRKSVGDNPEDINNKFYGNNIVVGPDKEGALHGTHVAGIIAQVRGNGIGGDGIVQNVEILPVRAVPNGDEYDKDIALAIRYAVDNGAKVINGSFGKNYSPHKEWVYDALRYAASKDVLFVHAAGNDSKNVDIEPNFPSDEVNKQEISDNVITVGALNPSYNKNLIASFSNFGSANVDIFSPGEKIYATIPNNKYKYLQGTSMAAPNVAGVAALIRSYYPNLKASQVKQILMLSGTPITIDVKVGEKQKKVPFAKTCSSGKIANAYNALKMAEEMSKTIQ